MENIENYDDGYGEVECFCGKFGKRDDMTEIEGVLFCPSCIADLHEDCPQEEERWYQVTREMAKDAEDIRLEGQWVKW